MMRWNRWEQRAGRHCDNYHPVISHLSLGLEMLGTAGGGGGGGVTNYIDIRQVAVSHLMGQLWFYILYH